MNNLKKLFSKIEETTIELLIKFSGIFVILSVILIFLFLLKEGLSVFNVVNPIDFIFGKNWRPVSEPPSFGILPLILGSLLITITAITIAVPFGVVCAVFIAEVAPKRFKEVLKVSIELLAAIPSVVIGFIGMFVLGPFIQKIFALPTGLTALTGAIMLALMAMPTIVSISEDAINSVPKKYKEASYALGATKWQTIWRVIVPSAAPGILAAVMLGIGRVIGETMCVMMVTGNSPVIPKSILQPVRTLTATIGAEMGETVQGGEHYHALFAIGIVLFVSAFVVNLTADIFLHKKTDESI